MKNIVPVISTPSNIFQPQLSLYTAWNYIILIILALVGALLLFTNIHGYQKLRART